MSELQPCDNCFIPEQTDCENCDKYEFRDTLYGESLLWMSIQLANRGLKSVKFRDLNAEASRQIDHLKALSDQVTDMIDNKPQTRDSRDENGNFI